jgi:uncharacterized protein YidB (DUF937 family)
MDSSIENLLGGLLGGGSGSPGGLGGLGNLLGGGGGAGGGTLAALLPVVTGMLAGGGLSKILGGMQAAGLGGKAESWVGGGDNQQISAEEVKQVVDPSHIAEVAEKAGVSHDEAAGLIAQALPAVVDHVTPAGEVPDAASVDHSLDALIAAAR